MRTKISGERESPWSVPRKIWRRRVHPWGVRNCVCASKYRLETIIMKSSGMPRNRRMRVNWMWSADGKAAVKSRKARMMSFSCVWASSMHRPKCVIALEQERCGLNPSCSGLSTLCSSAKSEARMYKHDVQSL